MSKDFPPKGNNGPQERSLLYKIAQMN
jgi:hypothetical protein